MIQKVLLLLALFQCSNTATAQTENVRVYTPFYSASSHKQTPSIIVNRAVAKSEVYYTNTVSVQLEVDIEFTSVRERNGFAELQWGVENSRVLDHFEVERMELDGDYRTIALVMGDEDLTTKDYTYRDKLTGSETVLRYRIKLVTTEGIISYSSILKLNLKQVNVTEIKVVPNAVSATAQLNVPQSHHGYLCRIYDTEGRMIQTSRVRGQLPTINISNLISGSYFLEAFHPQTGKRFYGKFTKQ